MNSNEFYYFCKDNNFKASYLMELTVNELVDGLDLKIKRLIESRNILEADVTRQRIANEELKKALEKQKTEFNQLENQYKLSRVAGSLTGEKEEGTELVRKSINELIREIDKCLELLNK